MCVRVCVCVCGRGIEVGQAHALTVFPVGQVKEKVKKNFRCENAKHN